MGRGVPPPPPYHFFIQKKKKCNFFCNFHVIQKSLDELICLEILPKVWSKFLIFSWKVLYVLDFWIYCICMFFVTIISCRFRKIIKKFKEYQRFWDPGSVFSGHAETKILKFSPASATKVRLPGRGGREGRERKGGKEGREGRGEEMGCFYPPPHHFKMCCYGPEICVIYTVFTRK